MGEAEELFKQVLEQMEEAQGEEHSATLTSMYYLASFLYAQKQYDDASMLYQRAILGFQRLFGDEHPRTLECSKQYASMLEDMRVDSGSALK